jgi:hypothetical protein
VVPIIDPLGSCVTALADPALVNEKAPILMVPAEAPFLAVSGLVASGLTEPRIGIPRFAT